MSARGASGAQATPFAILCACLAFSNNAAEVEALAARGAFDWPAVLRLAGHHLVTPSLAAALSRKGLRDLLDDEARDYLNVVRGLNRDRNSTLRGELLVVAEVLNRIGVQPVLLKGANALLPDGYDGAKDRVIGDLDLLVPAERLPAAADTLRALGYRDGDIAVDASHHHLTGLHHPALPVRVELHGRPLRDMQDSARLMERAAYDDLLLEGRAHVRVLDATTRLLHNALHAQISDGQRRLRLANIRQLLDFALLARSFSVQADDALARIERRRREPILEYWAQAEHWLGLPYPADMPRARHQARELWLTERIANNRRWYVASKALDLLRGEEWSELPSRLIRHVPRILRKRGYLTGRLRGLFD